VAHGLVASVHTGSTAVAAAAAGAGALAAEPQSAGPLEGPPPPYSCASLSPGEWLDATTSGGVVAVTLPQLVPECCGPAGALGRAGPPPPPQEAVLALMDGASPTAALLRLAPSHLAAFVATLPAGPKRLQQWHSSNGVVSGGAGTGSAPAGSAGAEAKAI